MTKSQPRKPLKKIDAIFLNVFMIMPLLNKHLRESMERHLPSMRGGFISTTMRIKDMIRLKNQNA